ncbi:hypothetical protein ABK040_000012 [Willaertia magna]
MHSSHEEIMTEGGFTVVSSRNTNNSNYKNKKVINPTNLYTNNFNNNKRGSSKKSKHKIHHFSSTIDETKKFNSETFELQIKSFMEPTTFISDYIYSKINENFKIKQENTEHNSNNNIQQIICYGIGNFLSETISICQFVVLLALIEKLRKNDNNTKFTEEKNGATFTTNSTTKVRVFLYDPIIEMVLGNDKEECNKFFNYLKEKYDIEWILENEECKRKLSNEFYTFIYMPHCSFTMYYNLLTLNKNILDKLILFSNPLSINSKLINKVYSIDKQEEILIHENVDLLHVLETNKKNKKKNDLKEKEYYLNFVFNHTNLYFFKKDCVLEEIFPLEVLKRREVDMDLIKKKKEENSLSEEGVTIL